MMGDGGVCDSNGLLKLKIVDWYCLGLYIHAFVCMNFIWDIL